MALGAQKYRRESARALPAAGVPQSGAPPSATTMRRSPTPLPPNLPRCESALLALPRERKGGYRADTDIAVPSPFEEMARLARRLDVLGGDDRRRDDDRSLAPPTRHRRRPRERLDRREAPRRGTRGVEARVDVTGAVHGAAREGGQAPNGRACPVRGGVARAGDGGASHRGSRGARARRHGASDAGAARVRDRRCVTGEDASVLATRARVRYVRRGGPGDQRRPTKAVRAPRAAGHHAARHGVGSK